MAKSAAVRQAIIFHRCETCACLFAPEAAVLAQNLYQERASNNYAPNKSGWMKAVQRILMWHHYGPLIKKHGATSLVDYGCGNGVLANTLAAQDLAVFAIDVQEERPAHLDPAIMYSSTHNIDLKGRKGKTMFILRHVLEHFEHPVAELSKIAALANTGDIFVIETPTADSLFKRLLKDGWPGYFPPFHVTVPTLSTLLYVADRAGLNCKASDRREPPIMGGYFARNAEVTSNTHRIAGLLLYPAQFVASKLTGMSEAIEVILEKP